MLNFLLGMLCGGVIVYFIERYRRRQRRRRWEQHQSATPKPRVEPQGAANEELDTSWLNKISEGPPAPDPSSLKLDKEKLEEDGAKLPSVASLQWRG